MIRTVSFSQSEVPKSTVSGQAYRLEIGVFLLLGDCAQFALWRALISKMVLRHRTLARRRLVVSLARAVVGRPVVWGWAAAFLIGFRTSVFLCLRFLK